MLVAESSRKLDADVLPDLEAWDVRRYGGTQIAIRTVGERRATADAEARPRRSPIDGDRMIPAASSPPRSSRGSGRRGSRPSGRADASAT